MNYSVWSPCACSEPGTAALRLGIPKHMVSGLLHPQISSSQASLTLARTKPTSWGLQLAERLQAKPLRSCSDHTQGLGLPLLSCPPPPSTGTVAPIEATSASIRELGRGDEG